MARMKSRCSESVRPDHHAADARDILLGRQVAFGNKVGHVFRVTIVTELHWPSVSRFDVRHHIRVEQRIGVFLERLTSWKNSSGTNDPGLPVEKAGWPFPTVMSRDSILSVLDEPSARRRCAPRCSRVSGDRGSNQRAFDAHSIFNVVQFHHVDVDRA